MATTIKLTGRLADITSAPISQLTECRIKAPAYAPGPAVEITTSAPQKVDVGADGAVTVNVVEGVGWIYLTGPGWTESIRFVAATGMTTLWEAVINALPIIVEAKRLLTQLGAQYESARADLIRVGAQQYVDTKAMIDAAMATIKADRDTVLAHVQALAAPNDAAVLGLLTDPRSQTASQINDAIGAAVATAAVSTPPEYTVPTPIYTTSLVELYLPRGDDSEPPVILRGFDEDGRRVVLQNHSAVNLEVAYNGGGRYNFARPTGGWITVGPGEEFIDTSTAALWGRSSQKALCRARFEIGVNK